MDNLQNWIKKWLKKAERPQFCFGKIEILTILHFVSSKMAPKRVQRAKKINANEINFFNGHQTSCPKIANFFRNRKNFLNFQNNAVFVRGVLFFPQREFAILRLVEFLKKAFFKLSFKKKVEIKKLRSWVLDAKQQL